MPDCAPEDKPQYTGAHASGAVTSKAAGYGQTGDTPNQGKLGVDSFSSALGQTDATGSRPGEAVPEKKDLELINSMME